VRLTEAAADLAAAAGTSGVAATPASASSSNSSSSALTSSAAPPEFVVASEASGLEVYRIVAGGAAVEKVGVGAGAEPGSAVSVAGGPGEPGGATPGYMAVRKTASFFEFSLCLSRACLGKMIVFIYKCPFCSSHVCAKNDQFTKTGSGQTQRNVLR
jgi:hypothetical protein